MDSSSPVPDSEPLPAFGLAIYSFHSSKDKPRINAHVSVLFLEEDPSDIEDFHGKGAQQDEKPKFVQAMSGKEVEQTLGIP